ncbi:MAG: hypothetical protein L0956_00840 [Candidatus Mariimomonas ferrooxydans]
MQLDMHYYGVFALARAAGLKEEHAKTIATASQFVDDNVEKELIEFQDAARFRVQVTGHHAINIKNIDLDDQRQVWVPFHFLPGNEGDSYTEKLICRKNSMLGRDMVDYYVRMYDESFIVELIGVAAHVYADTFSHFGFSGVSSRRNLVNQKPDKLIYDKKLDAEMKKYIKKKILKFAEKYGAEQALPNVKSWFSFTVRRAGDLIEKAQGLFREGALGHAGAYTLPDRPYLEWEYSTEYPSEVKVERNNPKDFLEGCEALYNMFVRLAEKRGDLSADDRKDFEDIKGDISNLLNKQASMEDRIKAWQTAVKDGKIYRNGPSSIPDYDKTRWHTNREGLKYLDNSSAAIGEEVFRFYQAASFHRNYVLRILLPKHNLVVH